MDQTFDSHRPGTGQAPEPARRTNWKALDGMRALAVVAVILFHLDPTRSPELDPFRPSGGFLGVDVFFVISGFLITSLLVGERARTGRVSLRDFYARRALRLFPALAAAIVVALVIVVAVHGDSTQKVWLSPTLAGLPWVILYVGNWHIVAIDGSITNGALLHTWSLAIEEQFYLLFPLAFILYGRRSQKRLPLAAGLTVVSLAVMAWRVGLAEHIAHQHGPVLDRIYYGTDTHCDGLLLGCALALVASTPGFKAWIETRTGRLLARTGAWIGAAALVALLLRVDQNSMPGMEIGISGAEVATMLILVGVLSGLPGPLRWVLEHPLATWTGKRSYGLYLYGFMLNIAVATAMGPHPSRFADLIAFVLTFVVAGVSYRFLEQPFLRRKRRFERNEAVLAPVPAPTEPARSAAT